MERRALDLFCCQFGNGRLCVRVCVRMHLGIMHICLCAVFVSACAHIGVCVAVAAFQVDRHTLSPLASN